MFLKRVNVLQDHLFTALIRNTGMHDDGDNRTKENEIRTMYERSDERFEMQLPCRLEFPKVWSASVEGFTANLNRKGISVSCRVKPGKALPAIGDQGKVHIELPLSSDFPPKFMNCETTLVRIDAVSESEFQFALQIKNVDFADISSTTIEMMDLDSDTCRYVM